MRVIIFGVFNTCWFHTLSFYSLLRISKTNDMNLKKILLSHAIACLINGLIAMATLLNMHMYHINGRDIYLLRYIEWVVCTPLLTSEICQAGEFEHMDTTVILCLTIAFNLCGMLAAITRTMWAKIILGVQGTIYSLFVVHKLLSYAFRQRQQSRQTTINIFNIFVTAFVWPLYVITWGLGPDVYGVITGQQEWVVQSVMSIILKTMFASYAMLTHLDFDIENVANVMIEIAQNSVP